MRALVVGANGFAGRYMCRELENNGYSVTRADVSSGNGIVHLDIMDQAAIEEMIDREKPEVIFNLAGFASVSRSFADPQKTISLNVIGSINILEAVRAKDPDIRVVLIGSSDQYGNAAADDLPVTEASRQNPMSPYAISKRCQEDIGVAYSKLYGMNVFMTHSFNHIGVGQRTGFVVTDFAKGIADIEKGLSTTLRVGNTNSYRSFTDVRDTVRAYRLIAERGKPGSVYNVGSEKQYSIKYILDTLIGFSTVDIAVEVDKDKIRPFDTPCVRCDSTLLSQDTGWQPMYSVEQTLKEILDSFRGDGNA